MSDMEIYDLVSQCKTRGNVPWEDLVNRFSEQLVALSGRLTEEELYPLMEIAIACYQKGYDEFTATQEARLLIKKIRGRSRRAANKH